MTKLSPSFSLEDFACHSGEQVPQELIPNVADLTIGVLQRVRNRWGIIIVICGYRSPAYNEALYQAALERAKGTGNKPGVAKDSAHILAMAADIRPVNRSDVPELAKLVEKMHAAGELPALGGFGIYPGWVHLDIKHAPDGHLRRWFGDGVGSEKA